LPSSINESDSEDDENLKEDDDLLCSPCPTGNSDDSDDHHNEDAAGSPAEPFPAERNLDLKPGEKAPWGDGPAWNTKASHDAGCCRPCAFQVYF
jgi:hypothetical protein